MKPVTKTEKTEFAFPMVGNVFAKNGRSRLLVCIGNQRGGEIIVQWVDPEKKLDIRTMKLSNWLRWVSSAKMKSKFGEATA